MNRFLKELLPRALREKLEGRQYLQDVVRNTAWLFADKVVRLGFGLFVGVWVARYLGPAQFGVLSYAQAYVALFSAIAALGLDSVAVRDIVRDPSRKEEILGTVFFLKLLGAAVTVVLAVGTILVVRPGDTVSHIVVGIIALGTIFQAFDAIDFWFQSQVLSKFTVYAKNSAFLIVSVVKIALILSKASVVSFAAAGLVEIALGSIGLILVYRRNGHRLKAWRFRRDTAGRMLADSWPLILSGIVVMVYIRIDQVMIGNILGIAEVGIYSVAVNLTEVWYFIPMAITSSVLPAIVDSKRRSEAQYYDRLKKLYLGLFWLSLVVPILITLFAESIILLVFGEQYRGASTPLSIQCWAGIFVFSGLVSNHWYLVENLNRYNLYRHIAGAAVNIGLNVILIPRYGISGAAFATLITQFASSYLFDLINVRTRVIFRIKTRTFLFFLPDTIRYVSEEFFGGRKTKP
jgi:PST family polysaccharide transporter